MTWTGTFAGTITELFDGVEGYFALNGVGAPGQIPTINDVSTDTQVSFRAPNYLGRITFFGDDLTTGTTVLPNGTALPILTSGTLTGIEFSYNYTLARARDQGISDISLHLPSLLEPSVSIQLPNIPATALTDAIVQSYAQNNPFVLRGFLSQFNHSYVGTENSNGLQGFDNNDLLVGLGGNDLLSAFGGNDTLDGGPGTDGLDGGEGSDLHLPGPPDPTTPTGDSVGDSGRNPNDIDTVSYINAPGPVAIDLNAQDGDQSAGWARGLIASGIERVVGSNFNDVIYGRSFAPSITETANDILVGGGGDDTLFGFAGSDELQGGPGFDQLIGGINDNINAPGPGDSARFNASSNEIDVFFQNDGSVLVAAPGGGVDRLIEVEFLALNDGVFNLFNFAPSQRALFIADDSGAPLNGGNLSDLLFGRLGDDVLLGFGGNDRLEGGEGADTLDGGVGADVMIGGNGGDTYFVDNAGDAITEFSEGGGIDAVFSSVDYTIGPAHLESVTLTGAARLARGNDLDNTLVGNDGANVLDGQAGANRLEGAGGDDIYIVRSDGDVVVEAEGGGRDVVRSVVGRSLSDHVEDLELLGAEDIDGTGTAAANTLLGNGGANRLNGLAGDDLINGFAGDDTIDGGAGNDTLVGGQGSDLILVTDAGDRVVESRRWEGSDTVEASVDFRMGRQHIEDLELTGEARLGAGNGLRNLITGNDADNILDGGKNVDTLIGGLGDDRYLVRAPGDNAVEQAGEGTDTVLAFRAYALDAHIENLFLQTLRNAAGEGVAGVNGIGNALANLIVGNPFDNFITGREGRDTLKGQAGADTFVFDRALGANNVDRIIDFNANEADEGDRLLFKQSVFFGAAVGDLDADAFATGLRAGDADDRFIFHEASGRLWYDADGTGAAGQNLIATFEQDAVVTADDIALF